jgi:glycosyltransferase involved in cell wall biosynthesis
VERDAPRVSAQPAAAATGSRSLPSANGPADVLCFSQLRWDFVYQRPHHLMARAARDRRVWFVEEPIFDPDGPRLIVEDRLPGLHLVRPAVPLGSSESEVDAVVSMLLRGFTEGQGIRRPIAWYHTPMAVPWNSWLEPAATIYDCMDELSAFRFASPRVSELEGRLLERADVVFTGGQSLFEAKRPLHANVHAFPSAVDAEHFARARAMDGGAEDQRAIPRPRVGWFGVIDERMDLDLVAHNADLRPDWSFVFVGPIVKLDPDTMPMRPNVHVLGPRSYADLPAYIAGWDVAMMPFARNESTRFISPTKTLEYLAAGRPVVSTSIQDVVEPYGRLGLVRIADRPADFVAAVELALAEDLELFHSAADAFIQHRTWDETWARMSILIDEVLGRDGMRGSLSARTARKQAAPETVARTRPG